jgi:hypothetical protein
VAPPRSRTIRSLLLHAYLPGRRELGGIARPGGRRRYLLSWRDGCGEAESEKRVAVGVGGNTLLGYERLAFILGWVSEELDVEGSGRGAVELAFDNDRRAEGGG